MNYQQITRILKKNKKLKNTLNIKLLNNFLSIKQIPDLIVLYNQTKEVILLKEIVNVKIPFISFLNSSGNSKELNYKVPGGFHNLKTKHFIYFLLKSILTLSKFKKI